MCTCAALASTLTLPVQSFEYRGGGAKRLCCDSVSSDSSSQPTWKFKQVSRCYTDVGLYRYLRCNTLSVIGHKHLILTYLITLQNKVKKMIVCQQFKKSRH